MTETNPKPEAPDASHPDAGLFGQPLFRDPGARALSRVGVVDVGSNSVRLVVFDGAARSPAYFYNEKIMCALGAGLSESGILNPQGRLRALNALRRFQHLAQGMGLPNLTVVATAAVRDASDGRDFVPKFNARPGCASGSSMEKKRRGCLPRAFCWAGRALTGWFAILAARLWSWPKSRMGAWVAVSHPPLGR